MAAVRFVDTSVLCDLLKVPGKCQRHAEVIDELRSLGDAPVSLVLPIAAIIETGNHIAQAADGRLRRASARAFVELLRLAARSEAPWVLHSVAGAGTLGAGDVSILAECEFYAARTAGVEVDVWTHDRRLAAHT